MNKAVFSEVLSHVGSCFKDAEIVADPAQTVGEVEAKELREHWNAFCDADGTPDGFADRMEDAGFIELVETTQDHMDSISFPEERGMEVGSQHYELTAKGSAALAAGGKEG